MRLALVTLVITACFITGCGEDDSTTATDTGGGTADTEQVVDDGCSPDHPTRLANNGLEGFFRACATARLDSVVVTNTSSATLTVQAANAYGAPQLVADALQSPSSVKELLVRQAVQGQCHVASTGPCRVPPSGRLLARGDAPVSVRIDIDPVQTGVATGAAAAGGYAESKFGPRAIRFRNGALACAKSVSDYASPNEYIEDWVRDAFALGSCKGLVDDIDRAVRQLPAPAADDATRALSAAGRYTKNLRQDFYGLGAARIAAQIR